MTTMLDLETPARQVATLVRGVADDQLSDPTPCESTSVAGLLDHLMGLTLAFRMAADKEAPPEGEAAPHASADNLAEDWRSRLPAQLDELVAAWRRPAAWEGTATAGGVTMPADVAAVVALDELVLHGWDLARATGQPFSCDPASTQAVFDFTAAMCTPEEEAGREGLFGPVVDVPADAPLLDRALGQSGRDPSWTL